MSRYVHLAGRGRSRLLRGVELAGLLGCLLALASVSGCQRLNFEKEYKGGDALSPRDTKELEFSPPQYAQKVTVTVSASGGPCSAYLVKKTDVATVRAALSQDRTPPAAAVLGSRESTGAAEEYSCVAEVPAKTEYVLLLRAHKQESAVKVKVVGR